MDATVWKDLSGGLGAGVEKAARFTFTVTGGHGYPSTGVAFDENHVLTASHSVERDEDITVVNGEGKSSSGRMAGRDAHHDLALVEMDNEISTKPQPPQ